MEEELNREKADKLFEQGMLLYSQTKTSDGFKLVAELWEKALEIYKNIEDEEKIKQLEVHLTKLYKKRVSRAIKKPEIADNELVSTIKQRSSEHSEGKIIFNEWDTFFKIGCFGFGGPMAVFGLLQEELVTRRKILTNKDFLEGAVLGDILPGPVTMDIVTYTGYKLKKWWGAVTSTLLFILPSFIIMLILAMFYDRFASIPRITIILKCLGAAVTGLIISVGMKLSKAEVKNYIGVGIFVWAFFSSLLFKLDMIIVVIFAGIASILLSLCGGYFQSGYIDKT